MSSAFTVIEHVIDAQHIREYPRALAHSQNDPLKLAVKQYIPKGGKGFRGESVTVIASHANGFVKELYEPLWEDLVFESRKNGFDIRSIWIADVAWQGQSGILNEQALGNDPSWLDAARDILHMTNVFRKQMPRPIIGIGHSFGATIVTNLALMHPRLFTSTIMIDPILYSPNPKEGAYMGASAMVASAGRKDLWECRKEAAKAIEGNKFYQTWDPRVRKALVEYGFRETPTNAYPDFKDKGKVTLTTTKHQEVFTYYRPLHPPSSSPSSAAPGINPLSTPDAAPFLFPSYPTFPFYACVNVATTSLLPSLRPPTIFIYGETSRPAGPPVPEEVQKVTGYGVGGSRSRIGFDTEKLAALSKEDEERRERNVQTVVIPKLGHLIAMECPGKIAEFAARFVAEQGLTAWRREEDEYQKWVHGTTLREKQVIGEDLARMIKSVGPPGVKRRKKQAKL